jgi:hypothetical protein
VIAQKVLVRVASVIPADKRDRYKRESEPEVRKLLKRKVEYYGRRAPDTIDQFGLAQYIEQPLPPGPPPTPDELAVQQKAMLKLWEASPKNEHKHTRTHLYSKDLNGKPRIPNPHKPGSPIINKTQHIKWLAGELLPDAAAVRRLERYLRANT